MISSDGFHVGHTVLHPKIEKAHEQQVVAYLVFDLIIREIVESLQKNSEHQHLVPWWATGFALLGLSAPDDFQLRPETLERHFGLQ